MITIWELAIKPIKLLLLLLITSCGAASTVSNNTQASQIISSQNASQVKLLTTLRADKVSNITDLSFGKDKNTLFSGSDLPDNTIRIWNILGNTQRVLITGKGQGITDLAFSHDGTKIAYANALAEAVVWDITNQKEAYILQNSQCLYNEMTDLDFDPQGTLLASACAQIDELTAINTGLIQVWNAQTGTLLNSWQTPEIRVWTVSFSPDGKLLASGSGGDLLAQQAGVVRIYDVNSNRKIAEFRAHTKNINQLMFSPKGNYLASASSDGSINLWDVRSKKLLLTMKHPTGGVNSISFHPSGELLTSAGDDGTIRVWDVTNGAELVTLHEEFGGIVYKVSFDPTGTIIAASGSSGGLITLWGIK